ncbi:hypothetical protein J437_LFUL015186 [Ladona fulva]|uniref:EF-hand domain-containing protein n=1 Tax=Ladona fulva TaxID=123851 RepID=A0A8K0KS87_LADFU|nr:hypothetical protein J437_LFUL015186 [Ladona fulva]
MQIMRKAFQMFDTSKSGFIETLKISTILNTIGQAYDDGELNALIEEQDPNGNGYITTATLREILAALDDKLGPEDLDGIIAEIDTDGSGTVDFDEFMEMMTGE